MSEIYQKIRTAAGWVVVSLLAVAGVTPANAGVILSPVSVVATTLGGTPTSHIIDGSGLSFISGVTDYDTYVAGNPTHAALQFISNPNGWASATGFAGKFMEFDLGADYDMLSFALWTQSNGGAVNSFTLSSAADQNFTTGVTNLGTFVAAIGLNVQTFTITGTGEFVKLQINSDHGNATVNIGEVAFDVVPIPEPTAITVLGLGLAGLGQVRRKRGLAA